MKTSKNKKNTTILTITKTIIELVGIVLLILLIVYLFKSKNGIITSLERGTAQQKLNKAIKIFSSTDGMELKTALNEIEGLEDLQINEKTGEYNIKIDGQEFFVISTEIIPEEENSLKNTTE